MKACIICQKDLLSGRAAKVKEDFVISTIRKIKQMLNIARNKELYVCENDLKTQQDKRKAYERDLIVFSIVAAIVFLLLIAAPLLSGRFEISFLFASLFLSALIILIPVFFKYTPAIDSNMENISASIEEVREEKREQKESKKAEKLKPKKFVKKSNR